MRKNLIIKGNIGFLVIYSQKVPVEQSCSSQVELRVMEITQEPAAAAPFHQPLNVSPRHMHRENKTKNKKKSNYLHLHHLESKCSFLVLNSSKLVLFILCCFSTPSPSLRMTSSYDIEELIINTEAPPHTTLQIIELPGPHKSNAIRSGKLFGLPNWNQFSLE